MAASAPALPLPGRKLGPQRSAACVPVRVWPKPTVVSAPAPTTWGAVGPRKRSQVAVAGQSPVACPGPCPKWRVAKSRLQWLLDGESTNVRIKSSKGSVSGATCVGQGQSEESAAKRIKSGPRGQMTLVFGPLPAQVCASMAPDGAKDNFVAF